jgi:hypothetical protein
MPPPRSLGLPLAGFLPPWQCDVKSYLPDHSVPPSLSLWHLEHVVLHTTSPVFLSPLATRLHRPSVFVHVRAFLSSAPLHGPCSSAFGSLSLSSISGETTLVTRSSLFCGPPYNSMNLYTNYRRDEKKTSLWFFWHRCEIRPPPPPIPGHTTNHKQIGLHTQTPDPIKCN